MSRRKTELARQRRAENRRHKCDVGGCTKARRGLSYYCETHAQNAKYYGHPLSRKVKKRDYEAERAHAVRFLRLHKHHPAVVAALKWAERWLRDAAASQHVPAASDMARLAAGGVTGADIIEEVLSLWLYSRWHPNALPDDMRLTKALGTNCLYLAPRETTGDMYPNGKLKVRRLGGTVRALVGEHIRRVLGVFVLHAIEAIGHQIKTRQEDMLALRVPFAPCELAAPTTPPDEGDTQTDQPTKETK